MMPVRESAMRGAQWHKNGDEWRFVALASLLACPRPERKKVRTACSIQGFPLRFLAQRGRVGHGEAAGGLGFGWGALYGRRCATANRPWFVSVERKRESEREGANGGAEEQRSGVVLLIVSQSGREERGPDGVDIAREEHGDDGVSNTAPVPCRIAATGVMGDKGEQR
jgi:hypothetical protein